jgi:hypothetical protein
MNPAKPLMGLIILGFTLGATAYAGKVQVIPLDQSSQDLAKESFGTDPRYQVQEPRTGDLPSLETRDAVFRRAGIHKQLQSWDALEKDLLWIRVAGRTPVKQLSHLYRGRLSPARLSALRAEVRKEQKQGQANLSTPTSPSHLSPSQISD